MEDFTSLISSSVPVLVNFMTSWCVVCKELIPELEQVSTMYDKTVKVISIDVDKNQDLQTTYAIQHVPTLMIFKDKKLLWRGNGVKKAKELSSILNQFL